MVPVFYFSDTQLFTMYDRISLPYLTLRRNIDPLQAWQAILSYPIRLGEYFTNPLRKDNNPRCYLRAYRDTILLTDYAYPQYHKYDAIRTLAELTNSSKHAAAQALYNNQHYQVPLVTRPVSITTGGIKSFSEGDTTIIISPFLYNLQPSYTIADKLFWSKRNVTSEMLLDKNQPCFSVHHYYVNSTLYYPKQYPCYALTFPESGHIKIYCPGSDFKFPASNVNPSDVWKWTYGHRVAVVTKSYKDGVILNTFGLPIDIYAFQNEGVYDPFTVALLKEKYDHVIILYDNDKAGRDAAKRLQPLIPGSSLLFYPNELGKDTDDLVVNNHKDYAIRLLRERINKSQCQRANGSIPKSPVSEHYITPSESIPY